MFQIAEAWPQARLADPKGPKWTCLGQNGPSRILGLFWSHEYENPVWDKVICTKLLVLTIWDHLGPAHVPPVPWSLLNQGTRDFELLRFEPQHIKLPFPNTISKRRTTVSLCNSNRSEP